MSRCVVIFHKELGDLVILEPALRCLAHGNGDTVDLITRSGFHPIGSLIPFVNFRSKPNAKIFDALWCFDDRRKSAFYSLLSRAREKHLLINPNVCKNIWAITWPMSWELQRSVPFQIPQKLLIHLSTNFTRSAH